MSLRVHCDHTGCDTFREAVVGGEEGWFKLEVLHMAHGDSRRIDYCREHDPREALGLMVKVSE